MTRSKLIQLVHIGAAKMWPDEDARRDWQQGATGHRSCSEMTDDQLQQLVDELFATGYLQRRAPRRAGRAPNNLDRVGYLQKIEAQLADMSLSWQYAESIAWRATGGRGSRPTSKQPGVKRLDWVKKREHFETIIAALEAEQKKRGGGAFIDDALKRLNKTDADIDAMLPAEMRGKWRRNIPWQDVICEALAQQLDALEDDEKETTP